MAGDLAEGGLVELPTTHLPSPEHEVHLLFRRSDAENPAIVALRSAVEAAWHRGTVFADSATR